MPEPVVGEQIARYPVLSKLEGGGMGVVFKAEDTDLNRPVALKFLSEQWSADPEARAAHDALLVEVRKLPDFAAVRDAGKACQRQFLAHRAKSVQ